MISSAVLTSNCGPPVPSCQSRNILNMETPRASESAGLHWPGLRYGGALDGTVQESGETKPAATWNRGCKTSTFCAEGMKDSHILCRTVSNKIRPDPQDDVLGDCSTGEVCQCPAIASLERVTRDVRDLPRKRHGGNRGYGKWVSLIPYGKWVSLIPETTEPTPDPFPDLLSQRIRGQFFLFSLLRGQSLSLRLGKMRLDRTKSGWVVPPARLAPRRRR